MITAIQIRLRAGSLDGPGRGEDRAGNRAPDNDRAMSDNLRRCRSTQGLLLQGALPLDRPIISIRFGWRPGSTLATGATRPGPGKGLRGRPDAGPDPVRGVRSGRR